MGTAGLLMVTAGLAQARIGRPGAVNYIEGQAYLGGNPIDSHQAGQAEVGAGQVLSTKDGKVEMLLTPGAFLRLDARSAVRMVTPTLTNTTVELLQGKAMVEADQVEKENHLAVTQGGATTVLKKKGIYAFNADNHSVAVYDGIAWVTQDDRTAEVYKGQELSLTQNSKLKTHSFNRKQEDDLYAWSKLRSEYTAEANMSMAQTIVVNNPGWWYGTGWYWNPWFSSWAFMPGAGFLNSPFGFGFYSPAYWYAYAPMYYRPGYGFAGRALVARPSMGGAPMMRGAVGGGFARGGFHR